MFIGHDIEHGRARFVQCGSARPGDAEVVELAVSVPQAEYERRSVVIAGDTDDNTVGSSLTFDLYPFATAWHVTTIGTFRDDALERRQQR